MKTVFYLTKYLVYWVLSVKAAEVMELGSLNSLMISCHCFLLMTSTRPPFSTTLLNNSYRSNTCFAITGSRFIGVPAKLFLHFEMLEIFEDLTSILHETEEFIQEYSPVWIIIYFIKLKY